MRKHTYELIVGNIVSVELCFNLRSITKRYNDYVKLSKWMDGKAAGEPVTLMRDDESIREYLPPKPKTEADKAYAAYLRAGRRLVAAIGEMTEDEQESAYSEFRDCAKDGPSDFEMAESVYAMRQAESDGEPC